MDWLTREPPSAVDVCGVPVHVRSGWRHAVRSYSVPPQSATTLLLPSWFSTEDGGIDPGAARHPKEAVEAALAWRDEAFREAMPYGDGTSEGGGPSFDLVADSGIVVADFLRLYGIDLTDRATQMHWWRFAALLCALVRTDGSLVSAAMSARSPIPRGVTGEAKDDMRRIAAAWALPLPEPERIRRANERVREEW